MHLLYLDESGSTDADHFVIAGFIIHWRGVEALSASVDQLIRHRIGDSDALELHAGQIRSGRRRWSRIPRNARKQLTEDVVELLRAQASSAAHPLTLLGTVADRSFVDESIIYEQAYRAIFGLCERWMRSRDDRTRCMIIADKTRLEAMIQSLARPNLHGSTRESVSQNRNSPFLEPPLFIDSRISRQVQLADFVAHWTYRAYEHDDVSIFGQLQQAFEQKGRVLSGLVHLTADSYRCRCIACRSRR